MHRMRMGVNETRQQHFPGQVEVPRVITYQIQDATVVADVDDLVILDGDSLHPWHVGVQRICRRIHEHDVGTVVRRLAAPDGE